MNRLVIALAIGLLSGAVRSAGAQLTLADAIHSADRSAYGNRIATGRATAAAAQSLAPLKGILPSVRFEAGYVRTTDPIGVFGSTLRQRAIAPANFDPERLNYPAAVGNFQGGIVLEQPVFNGDAWAGRHAALRAADASSASAEWTRLAMRVDVVRAYYAAVLASERVGTLIAAASAAHAHVAQAESMVRQGLVTKSDALLASVRAGDIDAQLAEAQGGATTARRQLAVLLGGDARETASLPALPRALPDAERIRVVVGQDTAALTPSPRADVRAASSAADAARADAVRARLSYAPRLNTFARYDWNSPARVYAGDKNWTVGIMASWSPFAGASDLSDVRASAGRTVAAQAEAAAAEANARLEAERTQTALAVALTRLDIAERAVAQSAEAHRIVARKYEGGLSTVVELLDAQAAETESALAFSQSRWGAIVAAAERLLALGRDPASLEVLDSPGSVAAARDVSPDQPPR
ncbi:MAG TPA: TolC family protein [Gemmatimonadaceae bacterium]